MVSIQVANLTRQKISVKEINDSVKQIVQKLRRLKKFPFLKNIDLSIVFLEPEKIRELNKKYRKKDKPTDILSFTLERTKNNLTGEIILCPEIIKTKDYGFQASSFRLQVNHLLAHGLLHLCDYDHKTEKEWKNMEKMSKLICYSLLAFAFVLFFISARVVSAVGVIQCLPLKAVVTNDLEVKNDLTVNRNEKILNNLTIDNDVFAAKKIYLGPDNLALYPYITNNAVQGISFYSQGGQNFLWQSAGIDAMVLGNPGAIPPDNGYALRVYGQVSSYQIHTKSIHLDMQGGVGADPDGVGPETHPNIIKISNSANLATPAQGGAAIFHGDVGTWGQGNLIFAGIDSATGGIDPKMAINTVSGKIGIGTNIPNTELDVAGVITFSGNRVIDGGAPIAYADTTEQYIVEATPLSKGKVKLVDYATMSRLCRDIDGCKMTVARINYDLGKPGQVATISGILFMSETSDWWRWSQYGPPDTEARDNNGAVEEWKNVDCYVTDAETSINAFDGRTDGGLGFGLLNMVGAGSASTTCRIIIED